MQVSDLSSHRLVLLHKHFNGEELKFAADDAQANVQALIRHYELTPAWQCPVLSREEFWKLVPLSWSLSRASSVEKTGDQQHGHVGCHPHTTELLPSATWWMRGICEALSDWKVRGMKTRTMAKSLIKHFSSHRNSKAHLHDYNTCTTQSHKTHMLWLLFSSKHAFWPHLYTWEIAFFLKNDHSKVSFFLYFPDPWTITYLQCKNSEPVTYSFSAAWVFVGDGPYLWPPKIGYLVTKIGGIF